MLPRGAWGIGGRGPVLGLLAIVVLYLATRAPGLLRLPIFVDEGIHLSWAFRVAETGRLLGVTDGGRYLPIALYALALPHAADPLLAARAFSVAAGLASVLGLVALGRALGDPRAGVLAALLYLAAPFTLFHDRMALVDALLACTVVWALVFAALWTRTGHLTWGLALGLAVGAACETKLYGALLLPLPPLALEAWRREDASLRRHLPAIYAVAGLLGLPVLLDLARTHAFVIENLWLVRSDANTSPAFLPNVANVLLWPATYLTPVGAGLLGFTMLEAAWRGDRGDRLLLGFWACWSIFFVLAGGTSWFPRYLLPAIPPLLFLAARRWLRSGPGLAWGMAALFAVAAFDFDRRILTDPAAAPLPAIDRWQYVEGWPAGYGLEGAVRVVRGAAAPGLPLVVLRDFRSGPLAEGLDLMLRDAPPGIEVRSEDWWGGTLASSLGSLRGAPGRVLVALERPAGRQLLLTLDGADPRGPIATFFKPGRKRQIEIHTLRDPDPASGRKFEAVAEDDAARRAFAAPSMPVWHGPWAGRDIRSCFAEDGRDSLAACRRVAARGAQGPVGAEARYHLGRLLLEQARHEEAARVLGEAQELVPDDVEQTRAYLEALDGSDRAEEALSEIGRFAAGPDVEWLHGDAAWLLARVGRWQEAETAYRRSLALDPEATDVRNNLGVVLFRLGRHDEARRLWREALRLEAGNVHARLNQALGQALGSH